MYVGYFIEFPSSVHFIFNAKIQLDTNGSLFHIRQLARERFLEYMFMQKCYLADCINSDP